MWLLRYLIELAGFKSEVKRNTLGVRPARKPREGWRERFEELGPDDCPLEPYVPTKFDEEEWQW